MSEKLVFSNIEGITVRDFLNSFHISKKTISKLENTQSIFINNQKVNFETVLEANDSLTIIIDDFKKNIPAPYDHPLEVVFEDEDILLVRKPPGLLVHSDGNDKFTLDNIVSFHFMKQGIQRTPRPCHRLDIDTCGLILYAKHFLASAHLNYQIENNLIKKRYYALVEGKMESKAGTIDCKIGRNRHQNNRYRVSKTGKAALTKYKVLLVSQKYTLLEVEILTGRRHQIRVHLQHLNHPVVGDAYYGKPGTRLYLEAFYLSFIHPRNHQFLEFKLPLPDDFQI